MLDGLAQADTAGVGNHVDSGVGGTPPLPDVRKAVRWNSPFYGIEGEWWLSVDLEAGVQAQHIIGVPREDERA